MLAINALTFGMDAVAILLALAFTHSWGLRVSPWPLLFPMWVATGFLAPFVITVPALVLSRALRAESAARAASEPSLLEPWVRGVVTLSFVGQGLALAAAFLLYVHARWRSRLRGRTGDGRPLPPGIVVLANAAALLAAATAVPHLLWTAGATFGLPDRVVQSRSSGFYQIHSIFVLAAVAACAGIVTLVNRRGRWPLWLSVGLTWTGAGILFSWGGWLLLAAALRIGRAEGSWVLTLDNVAKLVAGLAIAAVLAMAERASEPAR
jgi:hypothetical protein